MPDILDSKGLRTKTLTEIRDELTKSLRDIYGQDINVDQNSPDGQMINIFAQAAIDTRELLQRINSSFDPDQAVGTVLDQRVGINGIRRSGATYTKVNVDITIDKPVTLVGLDSQVDQLAPSIPNLFTIQDNSGTKFYLIQSTILSDTGVHSLEFRAAEIGKVEVLVNTIDTPVTIILGVIGINNSEGVINQGVDEETDTQLRLRRKQSVAIASTAYLDGIGANIKQIEGVDKVIVLENDTSVDEPGTDGIPAHSIWVIVKGIGVGVDGSIIDDQIAQVLYRTKSAGSGMKGDISVAVARQHGSAFIAKFDIPVNIPIYIKFKAFDRKNVKDINLTAISDAESARLKNDIVNYLNWEMGQSAGADDVIDFIKTRNPQFRIRDLLLAAENEDGSVGNYSDLIVPLSARQTYINGIDRILINE